MGINIRTDGYHRSPGKIITFWSGGKAGTGVTSTLYYLALYLAEKGASVAIADLNLKSPNLAEFLTGSTKGNNLNLDTLKPLLAKEQVMVSDIVSKTIADKKYQNLRYLLGTSFPQDYERFSTDEIDAILEALRMTADFVFVDVGAYPDNAGTIAGLANADSIKLIVDTDISCVKLFKLWEETLEGLNFRNKTDLVITKKQRGDILTAQDIEDSFGLEADCVLPQVNLAAAKNECLPITQITDSRRNRRAYIKQLHRLAEQVTGVSIPKKAKKAKEIFANGEHLEAVTELGG